MNQTQVYFAVGTIALPVLLVVLHIVRTRITLGPFFGVAGVYSLMLWQLLQTGWWVSFGTLHFNTALSLFIPSLILGFLLIFALDGLRTARAYMLMVLTTSAAAWLFSVFRESLAQHVPLPYLIVLSNLEHLAIILGLLLAQMGGMMAYTLIKDRVSWLALPGAQTAGVILWLVSYSLVQFGVVMGAANLGNESPVFLIATIPALVLLTLYGLVAQARGLFMPVRAWRHLLSFWRATQDDNPSEQSSDVIVNRDHVISELKLLNRQLADSGHVMETHMREAAYGILIIDERGRIRRTNQPACELLATPVLEGMNAQEILAARLKDIGTLDALVAAGEGQRHRTSDGAATELWIEIQATRLKGEGLNAGYYMILKDVTAAVVKERHQFVSTRVRDLYQTGRVLAHDFSNLLIGAQAQLGQLKTRVADAESRQSLLAIESVLQRAREMLQQLGTGNQFGTPKLNNLDLGRLVDESVAIVSAAAAEAGVAIQLATESGLQVEADASQMVRVFTNLIKNAVRASAPGSSVLVTLRRQGRGIEVQITDRGQGMTPEQLGMAFDPGFSTKDGGQGGLGLAISSLMTEAHGGYLELRPNAEGSGLTATVWLPEVRQGAATESIHGDLAGRSVILAMPPTAQAEDLAEALQRAGCLQLAEVYDPDELGALLQEDHDWQVLIVGPGFCPGPLPQDIPQHIEVRYLHDPAS